MLSPCANRSQHFNPPKNDVANDVSGEVALAAMLETMHVSSKRPLAAAANARETTIIIDRLLMVEDARLVIIRPRPSLI